MKQVDLFDLPEQPPRHNDPNPMVKNHGYFDNGESRCKDCRFIFSKTYSKKYYKCKFRGNTKGQATDHRCNWKACGKYEQVECSNCWDKGKIYSHTVWPKGAGVGVNGEAIYKDCECVELRKVAEDIKDNDVQDVLMANYLEDKKL